MAVIAMDTLGRYATDLSEVIVGGVGQILHGRRVAGSTHARCLRPVRSQAPADVRVTEPIRPVVEVEEMSISGGSGVTTDGPFTEGLLMTVATVVRPSGVGCWIDPSIKGIVLRWQTRQDDLRWLPSLRHGAADQVPILERSDLANIALWLGQGERTV